MSQASRERRKPFAPEAPSTFNGIEVRSFIEKRTSRVRRLHQAAFRGGVSDRGINMLRLINGIDRAPDGECWIWQRAKDPAGYGRVAFAGGAQPVVGAHRASYELSSGPIPKGMEVLHECDTPACINPAHLRIGTHAENMADAKIKGRSRGDKSSKNRGSANPRAKLNESAVLGIKQLLLKGEPQRSIAAKFGVGQSAISLISRGERWAL